MMTFYSLLIGENPSITKSYQPSSKRKIALYANVMMVPVIMWIVSSYLLVTKVLESGPWPGVITAAIVGILIFLIERSILMSNGSPWIASLRVTLGLAISVLGSICLDEIVFKEDINRKIIEYRQASAGEGKAKVTLEYANKITRQEVLVNQYYTDWQGALHEATGEADGSRGTGIPNVGPITKLKFDVARKLESQYIDESKNLKRLRAEEASAILKAEQGATEGISQSVLLLKVRAMFDLIAEDGVMMFVYIIFTVFLFMMEFLVVIFKMSSKESIDEKLEKTRDRIIEERARRVEEKGHIFFRPEENLQMVRGAREFLNEINSRNLS